MTRLKAAHYITRGTFLSALVAIALAWSLAGPATTFAHAELISSNPPAGALLDAPPQRIELLFSEGASLDFSSIKLYDRSRKEHPVGALERVGGNDASVAAPVPESLPPDTYTVVWRVVSADDGHLSEGSFAFRIRSSSAGGAQSTTPEPDEGPITPIEVPGDVTPTTTTQNADPFRWVLRALILANAVLLLGGCLFTLLIFEPSAGDGGSAGPVLWRIAGKRFALIGVVAGCLLISSLALDLVAETAVVGDTDLLGALSNGQLALRLVASTSYGFSWVLKLLAAFALLALMFAARALRTHTGIWEVAVAAGSLFLLGEALGSHAAASRGTLFLGLPLPVVSDWLHLVTAAAWAGGLGYMVLALFPAFSIAGVGRQERRAFLASSIPRFSRLALVSVVLLAVTGTYNLLLHSSDLGQILGSVYGQVLAVKIGVFVVLVAIGAMNLLRLGPRLRAGRRVPATPGPGDPKAGGAETVARSPQPDVGPVRSLLRNVRVESVLVAVALVCAGGLTLLPPPSQASITSAQTPLQSPVSGSAPILLVPSDALPPPTAEAVPLPAIEQAVKVDANLVTVDPTATPTPDPSP